MTSTSWASRAALAGAAFVLAGATVASLPITAGPVAAAAKPTVTISPGQTITQSYPAIPGQDAPAYEVAIRNGNADAAYPYPEHCVSGVNACDTIPVKLNVTPVTLVTHQLVLSVTVKWDQGPHVDNVSGQTQGLTDSAQGDNLASWIWPIPHGPGSTGKREDGYAAHAAWGSPPPEAMSAVNITTTNLAVVVENFSGVNKGYTVTYNLVDVSGGPTADLSVDKGFVDNSVIPTGAITQSAPVVQDVPQASRPTAVAPAESINALDTPKAGTPLADAPLTGDAQLDALVPHDDAAALGAQPPKRIGAIRRGPGPARPVTGSVALLWLVALPLAAGLAVLGLLLRRRRAQDAFVV